MNIKSEIKEFFLFFLYPLEAKQEIGKKKLHYLLNRKAWLMLIVFLLIAIISEPLTMIFRTEFFTKFLNINLNEIANSKETLSIGILIPPLLEETLYRLGITKNLVLYTLGSLIFSVLCVLIIGFYGYITILFPLVGLYFFCLKKFNLSAFYQITNKHKHILNFGFLLYIIFTIIIFALSHRGLYNAKNYNILIGLSATSHQVIGGLLLSYLRFKNGLIFAIILHTLVNLKLIYFK